MNKLLTFTRYFLSYLKHGDLGSIVASLNFVLKRSTHLQDRLIRTSIGLFYCRKETNDFQFANFYYEWAVKKYILKRKKEFSVFIDGGSCTGDYSILLAKQGLRCFAFEPVDSNFQALKKNLELNGLQNTVTAYSFGLGNKNEQVNFEVTAINTGASHKTVKTSGNLEKVEIRTLDSLLQEMGIQKEDSILFKLDVEGMEVEAIEGARTFIRDYPNLTLIVEKKHCGPRMIENALSKIAVFEYGQTDAFNLLAIKKIGIK